MGSFFNELKRRNVIRVAAVFVVVSQFLLPFVDLVVLMGALPEWVENGDSYSQPADQIYDPFPLFKAGKRVFYFPLFTFRKPTQV